MEANNIQIQRAPAPFDDTDADLVLQTSDNVVFHLHTFLMSKASSVFRDMLTVPQPPTTDPSTATEYLDGKPLIRVTEDSKTMDVFLRCCYPVPNPTLDISQLATVYGTGDKYNVEAVKQHAVSELSRFTPQPLYCLRAYVLACHFGLRDEAKRAARQTLERSREEILHPTFPELDLIPASSYTRLTAFRQQVLNDLAELFTSTYYLYNFDEDGKPPLWGRYIEFDRDCDCPISKGFMYEGDPVSDDGDDDDSDDDMDDSDRKYMRYWMKRWCARYMGHMAGSLRHDELRGPVQAALKDHDALARALAAASQCRSCGRKSVKAFLRLLEEIDKEARQILCSAEFNAEAVSHRDNLQLPIMQVNNEARYTQAPFDDPDADLILRTSDNVTFRLLSLFMSRASYVFRDMMAMPLPSTTGATAMEYVDGKPLVRVTEDGKTMDAFLRCCYPVPRPILDISQLAAMYALGDKYDVEAVKSHAVNELSRYTPQTEYSLRAYVLACHFGLADEAMRAARETLNLPKETILTLTSMPELKLIPASSLAHLLEYRQKCMDEVAKIFTPRWHLACFWKGRYPLWDRYIHGGPGCSCEISCGEVDGEDPHSSSEDEDDYDVDVDPKCTKFWVKRWCARYMNAMANSIREDRLTVPIRDAVKGRDAMAQAVAAATRCRSCGQKCVKEFLRLLKSIDADVERTIYSVGSFAI
ncbi:hypothetical protein NM688_g5839 [Phlebia brevispora]|uniref:Uncharacterized protein n=1 Tax=Phlebia brevispora TaxID=194682 RepID=A0ACC1SP73_9APHY|nr:hypothetical protein NM688_g5839 [Phlebia brevispora]